MENVYSKDEILVLYLNTVPFGDNVYGIRTAADRFFSTAVKNLSADQAAVLVGMLKATHTYNPRIFPDRSKQRRNVVLAQMEKYSFITSDEKKALQEKPLGLRYNRITNNSGLASYFREYIKNDLLAWCAAHERPDGKPYNLYTDGLKIYTTIDSRIQQYAEVAMQSQMKALQKKFVAQMQKQKLDEVVKSHLKRLSVYQRWTRAAFRKGDFKRTEKRECVKYLAGREARK